ncbi:maleylpyruvate isomerase family mycothiol-dependent enzyme [Streptomyces sp. ME19-01-6]|uniref:maleylpyruvate isomerase family mycothiol-dependent enzyme n=1 Tax=Streptomyces sp. ME19-01-6 TaxID=3028686 RepID=UPI00299FA78F|nr:maleylpyruvate isomerase family mycothiol-dependent enzyme [Streptomyces sp. ME19-01-6]MDX3228179.1 maleylpyruvate isomerase family mycothiol-dependent enzyme [Streptomyces sp. ME19-01-6]
MDTAELINVLDREGRLLADAAQQAGPDAQVPTCPEWRVRDLLAHIGMVHRWVTRTVTEGLTELVRPQPGQEPEDADLTPWFRDGHGALVRALTEADPDGRYFTILPTSHSPLAFWARRQAHETAVHRVDAESALGKDLSPVDPAFAADGLDELLAGFHATGRSKVRTEAPRTLRLRATDAEVVWTVRLSEGAPRAEVGDAKDADCELSGPVEELYLTLWNRLPLERLRATGDISLAELWRERSGF